MKFIPIYILSAALFISIASCQQKKEPGSTINTGGGSIYTKEILGDKMYEHTIQTTDSNGNVQYSRINDTIFSFTYIDDAQIKFGNNRFLYLRSSSSDFQLLFRNMNNFQPQADNIYFDRTNSIITINLFRTETDGKSIFERYVWQ